MSDLDEELLALTGGRASTLKRRGAPAKRSKKKKESSSESDSSSSDSESEEEVRTVTPRNKRKPAAKPAKKRKVSSDDESDSDAGFHDEYDADLYKDEADKRHLLSLPELQREEIIAERYAKRKEAKEQWELRRKLKRDKAQREKGKASGGSGSGGGASESPARVKRTLIKISGKASALSDLKSRTKPKLPRPSVDSSSEDDDERLEDKDSDEDYIETTPASSSSTTTTPSGRRKPSRGAVSAADSDDEDSSSRGRRDYDRDDDRRRNEEDPGAQPLSRELLHQICLKRDFLERKCEEPYFDEMAKDFYVRIGIGNHQGKPVYRVAQITGVKEVRKYKLGNKSTSKYLNLKHGASTKLFSMEHVSNQQISDSEFQKWKQEMNNVHVDLPTVREAEKMMETLRKFENYVYTEQDIQQMVERKRALMKTPLNLAAEKRRVSNLLDAAKSANNDEDIRKYTEELAQLEEKSKLEEERKKAKAGITIDKAQMINLKNREQQHTANARVEAAAVAGESDLDPFSRRRTKLSNFLVREEESNNNNNNNNNNANGKPPVAATAAGAGDASNKTATVNGTKHVDKLQSLKNKISKGLTDTESLLRKAHDFDLDDLKIEIDSVLPPEDPTPQASLNVDTEAKTAGRKMITLEDYKRRRGLI